ncbi:MAG: fibronectin type III-like domain-contianing protein, partial [Duncaniella sp.]|nr:fibronectin type III-like domain-contianing protein [Duncaniella sp.]
KIPALYPFGHGLSYTTFSYGKPVASAKTIGEGENLTISIPVTNTGDREGKETVQLYIGDEQASVLRPLKELKGFDKITLAPGAVQTVTFTVTPDDLKFYDPSTSSWISEPGRFKAYIGSSSADIRATVPFELR